MAATTLIERITPDQEIQLAAEIDRWLAIGRSVEPLDRKAAARAITAMYAAIGKPAPAVLFFSSPLMCLLARSALQMLAKSDEGSQLESQLRSQLWSQLESQLWSQLWSQLRSQLRSQLESPGNELWSQISSNVFAGAWWSAWEVFYDFCNKIGVRYPSEQRATLDLWLAQSRECHWWFPYDGIVFASERPAILEVDAQGRLHSSRGAALEYSDGYGLFALHGVRVNADHIRAPESLTPAIIDATTNQEERRVLIQHFGVARYVQESGAQVVHELPENYFLKGLQGARLLRKGRPGDSDIIVAQVRNSTPESDGSVKPYFLRIDPRAYEGEAARNVHAAIASTFRDPTDRKRLVYSRWQDYRPGFES